MTLTEFLLARIAEDEASLPTGHDCWYEPERYAVECEAKRRILELCAPLVTPERLTWADTDRDPSPDLAVEMLRLLALPYADHPDYREEWRP